MKDLIWTDNSYDTSDKNNLLATCPKCQKSKLSFQKFTEQITESGREMERMGYPNGIDHLFVGLLVCTNTKCKELVNVAGQVQKGIQYGGHDENGEYFEYHFDYYIPNYFSPNLRYFRVTDQIPKNIRIMIDLAFHHYFKDYNASANKVRTTIELILDNIKAPKKRWNTRKTKMVKFHNLHDRIENFVKRNKHIATLMLANKYIGNEGSHLGKVEKDELLDAFDNLEEIIDRIYIKKSEELMDKATKLINKKKGQ